MRKAMLLLAVFGLVGSLWAAEPLGVGTWKLNPVKSKLPPNMAASVKESILVFQEIDADTMEGSSTQTLKDGTTTTAKWTTPKSGGIQTYQQGAPEKGISTLAVVIDEDTIYNVTLQNGKQVQLTPINFGKDGKTFTITYKGTDAQGKPYEYFVLYEKQ